MKWMLNMKFFFFIFDFANDVQQLSITAVGAHELNSNTFSSLKSKSSPTINSLNSNGSSKNVKKHSDSNLASPMDFLSPTKKGSDHSISQLMSYPTLNHSTSILPVQRHPSQLNLQLPIMNNNNINMNNSKQQQQQQSPTASTQRSTSKLQHQVIDLSESDDAEIVEFSTLAKKPKPHKHKHNKKTKELGGLGTIATTQQMSTSHHTTSASIPTTDLTNDEIDHNQIIHDLKVNAMLFRKHFDL